jgi:hypothetical protein
MHCVCVYARVWVCVEGGTGGGGCMRVCVCVCVWCVGRGRGGSRKEKREWLRGGQGAGARRP